MTDPPERRRRPEPVELAFERRAARADALAERSSTAREPLEFAAGLFRVQGVLAAAIEDAHVDRALCGNLADDLSVFAERLAAVVAFAQGHGPPILRELAGVRLGEDPRARLCAFFGGSERDDYLSRALLRPYAEVLAAYYVVPRRPGANGGCPVCRGLPSIGWRVLRGDGDGAERRLGCGLCAHEWAIGRIVCPACGENRPDKLPAFQSDRYPAVRIEVCTTCRAYVKSIDLTVDARAIPEVDNLLSISLDVWAGEQGYERLEPGLAGI